MPSARVLAALSLSASFDRVAPGSQKHRDTEQQIDALESKFTPDEKYDYILHIFAQIVDQPVDVTEQEILNDPDFRGLDKAAIAIKIEALIAHLSAQTDLLLAKPPTSSLQ